MPRLPTLSVVIPTHNTRGLTCRCLAALQASDQPPDQIVVVDDGSSDGTAAAISEGFPRVTVIRRLEATGFTRAINEGWSVASGDLVLLLNSDTEVAPDALAAIRRAFVDDQRLGIAGATLQYMDGTPQWSAGRWPTSFWLFAMASGVGRRVGTLPGYRRVRPESQGGVEADWVPATAMTVRREVYGALGGFDPVYRMYAQDLDYCWRAQAAGWRIGQRPDVHVKHVRGATIGARVLETAAGPSDQDLSALVRDLAIWIERSCPPWKAWRLQTALRVGYRIGDRGSRIVDRGGGR